MNMQQIMARAQQMQQTLMKKKEEIDKTVFTGKSDWVMVEFYGSKVIKSVTFTSEEAFNRDNAEILSDMIIIAVKDAMNKIDAEIEKKLGNMGNLGGLI